MGRIRRDPAKPRGFALVRSVGLYSTPVATIAVVCLLLMVGSLAGPARPNTRPAAWPAFADLTEPSAAGGTRQPTFVLVSPNAQLNGAFGVSAAVGGTKVVVGAALETVGGNRQAGRVYVFSATSGKLISTLTSPNSQTYGDFGLSVAISGDTVAVGAPQESASGWAAAGHAYTFNATTGQLIATFTSPNPQGSGDFGHAIGIQGSTVVVGAPYENAAGKSGAGHVYTFESITGRLFSTLESPNAQAGGDFGLSVAIRGGVIAVGAPMEGVAGESGAGHAYIFKASTGDLEATLVSPNSQAGGVFGWSVAVGDRLVVVGAPGESYSNRSAAGQAYTFRVTSGAPVSTLVDPHPQRLGTFGWSVGISGPTILVGAEGDRAGTELGAGAAYTFGSDSGRLALELCSPNAQKFGSFGYAVAVSGSILLIGSYVETVSGMAEAGHAYVYTRAAK